MDTPGEYEDHVWRRVGDLLEGRVALVTGGGKGIGRGIALSLAEQGANVAVTDFDVDAAAEVAKEASALGVDARPYFHDVSKVDSTFDVFDQVSGELGNINILVNNAGVAKAIPMWDIDEQEWDRVNNINQKGLFFCCVAALRRMKESGGGAIINISSMAGREAVPLFSHYTATKFAAIGITQAIAKEASSFGIRAHAICPGVVRTPLWDNNLRELSAAKGITEAEVWQEFVDPIPLGYPQTPYDIGQLAVFLASDLSRSLTGQAINISGGMTIT